MNIIAIIPARGGSKGIPMKNLVKLNSKPLLYYSIKSSLNSIYINKTIVSTDDSKIANYALKCKSEVICRPKKLASNNAQIEPTIMHSIDYLKKHENYVPDIVVLLQNTSPFRTFNHVDGAIKFCLKKNFDSVLSGFKTHRFFWEKSSRTYVPKNYNPQKRPNRQNISNQFIENGAIYITKYNCFKKSKCRISGRIGLFEMPQEKSYEIDSKHDIFIVEKLLKK